MAETATNVPPPPSHTSGLPQALFKKLDALIRDCEGEEFRATQYRQHGIDADIAALKSVSRVYKERRQVERDRETVNLLNRARAYLYR